MLAGPVFNVELITTARRPRYYAIRLVYGMILLFFVVRTVARSDRGVSSLWSGRDVTIGEMAATGRRIFQTFAIIQGVAVLLLTPAIVAGVVADERQRKTLHYLMASRLNSAEIILGKLFARLLHIGVFLAVGLPVMSLITLFGGFEPLEVVLVYAVTVTTALFVAALAILVSTMARRPREANSQVYILTLAWFFGPPLVAMLMPMAGGRWLEVYEWIKPVNDVVRWSSPFSLLDPFSRVGGNAVGVYLWMVGLQVAFASTFVLLAILALRPIFRRGEGGNRRLGWLFEASRARRFFSRPEVGDDAMLWKERYVSRTSGIIKIAIGFIALLVVGGLGYGTYWFGGPAFAELWQSGYGTTGSNVARGEFNGFLRVITTLNYCVWCLGIAGLAAASVAGEREEDTWTSLTTTPLGGDEIIGAKMLGAVWGTRWIGLLLVAFWLIGLAAGAVHPVGVVAVALETAVFVWFVAALGVSLSLGSKTSVRAQTATMAILVFVNGAYLFCCIPLRPDTIFVTLGVTPSIVVYSLISYEECDRLLNDRLVAHQADIVPTCVAGVFFYASAALILTIRAFAAFDAKIDRPRRDWSAPIAWDKEMQFVEE